MSQATETFDLIVIGGGPAGYVAAIRAAQLGMKTACIEKRGPFGGTCLNVGCIPSKALLESSEHFIQAKTKMAKHGVMIGDLKLDLGAMMKRKDAIVRQLTNGIGGLFKKNKIEGVVGVGRLVSNANGMKTVEVTGETGKRTLTAPRVLLATGSDATSLPFLPFDEKRILSSTGALSIPEVPKHLVVIGGGVIGLELGSVWLRLGARVTVVEFQDRILPPVDRQVGEELRKILVKQGMEFLLSTKCMGAKPSTDGKWMFVQTEDRQSGTKAQLEADYVLVATGRKAYSDGLGLDALGIKTDSMGRVEINERFETNVPGVFAAGDLVDGPMLAHKAEEEGIAAVEIMAGQAGHVNYQAIPNVVYTWPEIATVGWNEDEAKERGIQYKVGVFPFLANARAKTMDESEGLVKVIADATTDRVIGVHICGPRASDMIPEAVAVMEFGGSAEDIARTCHAHPTLSETLKEAAMDVGGRKLHL